MLGAILRVALDGPQKECEVFESACLDGQHKLYPTAFARSCSKLWIQCYGRRFQYKYREPSFEGKMRKGRKRKGTFAAIQDSRKRAVDRLCRAGDGESTSVGELPSFIPGLDMEKLTDQAPSSSSALDLVGTRWGPNSAQSAQTKFQQHTDRKQARRSLC